MTDYALYEIAECLVPSLTNATCCSNRTTGKSANTYNSIFMVTNCLTINRVITFTIYISYRNIYVENLRLWANLCKF